jgi:hypothetical protein
MPGILLAIIAFACGNPGNQQQPFPYGTYYCLTPPTEKPVVELVAVTITPTSFSEYFADTTFISDPAENDETIHCRVDTIVREGDDYICILRGVGYKNGYYFKRFARRDGKFYRRESTSQKSFSSPRQVLDAAKADTILEVLVPLFTREQMHAMAKLPQITEADTATLIDALSRMKEQRKKDARRMERFLQANGGKEFPMRLYRGIGYMRFFAEAGISPFMRQRDLEALQQRYRRNPWMYPYFIEAGVYL